MKAKSVITTGFRIGKLTVEEDTGRRKNGYTIWRCRCDCGGVRELDTRTIKRGSITDCGCESHVKPGQKDLTGMRFGKLICVRPTDKRGSAGTVVWLCKCDCGGTVLADTHAFTFGYVKSCGCLSHPPLKNFEGKRFGRLTVTGYAGKEAGMHRWKCLCDCGNTTIVGQSLLQSGKTTSCGCRQKEMIRNNLRLVDGTSITLLESGKKNIRSTNTSGYTGVYKNRRTGKWVAQITFKGKSYYLGSYEKKKDAVNARRKGEAMHDEFVSSYNKEC